GRAALPLRRDDSDRHPDLSGAPAGRPHRMALGPSTRPPARRRPRLQVGAYLLSSFHIDQHPATRTHVMQTFREMHDAVAASPVGTTVYIENGETQAVLGPMLTTFLPGRAGLFLFLSSDDVLDGRHVRFVERDPDILAFWAARPGSRLATLLLAPSPPLE